jgi:hypothetical protein
MEINLRSRLRPTMIFSLLSPGMVRHLVYVKPLPGAEPLG